MLTTILWWYYYPHVAAREMEAMRLSNLPEVRGSWWRSRKQKASSSAPPCIFLLQHCHLVPKACFVLRKHGTGTKKGVKNDIFALHPHRLWLCHQAYMCVSLHATLPMLKKQHRPIYRIKFLLQFPMPATGPSPPFMSSSSSSHNFRHPTTQSTNKSPKAASF